MDAAKPPVNLAVFDFDGTCLAGNSTVMVARDLARRRLISRSCTLRLIFWGVRYALHLPRERGGSFRYIFSAFRGWTARETDAYMAEVYAETVRPRLRPGAKDAVRDAREAGCVCVLLSATFENMVRLARDDLGVDCVLATGMFKDGEGNYTGLPDGEMEGRHKVEALSAFADGRFGEGAWAVKRAFGDHVSDAAILAVAEEAAVVSPSPLMRLVAKAHRWPVLSW